jgi:hypothetical protein
MMFPNHCANSSFCGGVDENCALFGYNTRRAAAIPDRRFGTTYRPILKGAGNLHGTDRFSRNHYSLLNRLAKRFFFFFESPSVDERSLVVWQAMWRVQGRIGFEEVDRRVGMCLEVDPRLRRSVDKSTDLVYRSVSQWLNLATWLPNHLCTETT